MHLNLQAGTSHLLSENPGGKYSLGAVIDIVHYPAFQLSNPLNQPFLECFMLFILIAVEFNGKTDRR